MFDVGGMNIKRITLVMRDGQIMKVFYPMFPLDSNAQSVLDSLSAGANH